MFKWCAVYTRSNYEHRVAEELRGRGVENYLPTFREVHQWKDRKMVVQVPLFRSYLFARLPEDDSIRNAVYCSEGVVSILGSGGAISPIPDHEIAALRLMLQKADARCAAHPLLREGASVRVKRGPLKDLEGLLIRFKNQTRLVISITLLSKSVSVEMDASDVQVLQPPRADYRRIA